VRPPAFALVAMLAVAACGDDHGGPTPLDAPGSGSGSAIRACDDIVIDETGLTLASIDVLVTMFDGRACVAPLEGGIPSLNQECQYGAYLFVCGQSSGLSQFGCSCTGGSLECSNGERIKEGQERLCDGGM
jgi:hypothetical protein